VLTELSFYDFTAMLTISYNL